MGLEADAIAIAAGELTVINDADVLALAKAKPGRPIPVAAYRGDDWCAVYFVIKQTDDAWRTEIVPVYRGEIDGYGGGTGGIMRRSDVVAGAPWLGGGFLRSVSEESSLVAVEGMSADPRVRMRWRDRVVAEAVVAPHGHFVLAAVLPGDPDFTELTVDRAE